MFDVTITYTVFQLVIVLAGIVGSLVLGFIWRARAQHFKHKYDELRAEFDRFKSNGPRYSR